jgi:hypothetical protein
MCTHKSGWVEPSIECRKEMNPRDKIFIRERLVANFTEAIPLCLLLNKLHLFILKEHRFILIETFAFYIGATCFGLYLGHSHACQYRNLTKEVI